MMKRSVKFILSLLIATILSSVFTFFAFTNLFSLIETGLYYPNLKAGAEKEAARAALDTNNYLENAQTSFKEISQKDFIWRAYLSQQSAIDVDARNAALSTLFAEYKLDFVRLVDQTGRFIHFSTSDKDVEFRNTSQIKYKTLDTADMVIAGKNIMTEAGSPPRILWDGTSQRIIFSYPVTAPDGKYFGSALFFMKRLSLENQLTNKASLAYQDMRIVDGEGVLFDTSGQVTLTVTAQAVDSIRPLEKMISEAWAGARGNILVSPVVRFGEKQERYFLFAAALSAGGMLGVLSPVQRFEMGLIDKSMILAVFYITVFLFILLIGNLKQDPLRIVAERMHKFQVEFLKEFFEKKDRIDVIHWQKEIDSRREEIKRYMKRGIKSLSTVKEKEIDSYIINSWNEVVSVIKSKVQKPMESDLMRIESLLRKVLAEGRIVIAPSAQRALQADSASVPPVVEKMATGPRVGSPIDAADLEELEEVEEAEPVEELTVASDGNEPAPRTPVASADRVADAADIEELESLEEAPLDEEIADIEPVMEAEAELEPLEALDEGGEKIAGSAGAPLPSTAKAVGERIPEEGKEEIELLTVVPEINPLPPLPYEKLEELQIVSDEEKRAARDSDAYREFISFEKEGNVKIISVEEMMNEVAQETGTIVMRDGVYRIKEELFKMEGGMKKRKGLKALAQSILENKKEGISSIDELYGTGDFLEASEKAQIQEKLSHLKKASQQAKYILLNERGIDLDAYMEAFSYQITDKVMIYAIGELIKKAKAVSSILFTEDQGLKVNLSIGVTNRSAHLFHFTAEESFFHRHIKKKHIVLIEDVFQKIRLFTNRLSADDVKFIRSALFLPAVIDRKNAYLFFGFSSSESIRSIPIFAKRLEIITRQ